MPYKSEKIKLSETQDRRRKLTTEQKEEIAQLYSTGSYSLMQLARQYDVSKKTVLLIVNKESADKAKQYRKENWQQWQRTKEERAVTVREHRHYKQSLYLKGELNVQQSAE